MGQPIHVLKWGVIIFLIGVFGVIAAISNPVSWKAFDTSGLIIVLFAAISLIGLAVMGKGVKVKWRTKLR